MIYKCPVCAYSQMPHPPMNYNICPCCGVEFGLDDAFESHDDLRDEWLRAGGAWFSRMAPYVRPPFWDAWEQLDLAGYRYNVPHPPVESKTERVVFRIPENIELRLEPRFERVA